MASFDWTRGLLESTAVGGAAYAGTYLALGAGASVTSQYGGTVSLPMYIGAACAASELASLGLLKFIFPNYNGFSSMEATALNIAWVYGGLLGITYAVVGANAFNDLPKGTSLAIAAGSIVAAEYVYTHFLSSMFGGGGNSGSAWYN